MLRNDSALIAADACANMEPGLFRAKFMTISSADISHFLLQLSQQAKQQHCRFGVRIAATVPWHDSILADCLSDKSSVATVFQLGGEHVTHAEHVAFNKGQQFLGRECQLLICDVSAGLDANSFSAALGTLVGGGLLIVLGELPQKNSPATQWLNRCLDELPVITPRQLPLMPARQQPFGDIDFSQQNDAIDNVERVVSGHRKRPLVLTADRGRGKSSALGMAAARLMQSRNLHILVTAPSLASVAPLFRHAELGLQDAVIKRGEIGFGQSSLRFVAPDELISQTPDCDLLLVDEAAALPLPWLIALVDRYHRAVFSTTIHGYEGCGRGFTLKFLHWLQQERPQFRSQHIDQPIRWSLGDPLEAWHRRAFLLDYEFPALAADFSIAAVGYQQVSKQQLLQQPQLLSEIFSLLVNAHYQTSPNDLLHLLGDEAMSVYVAKSGQQEAKFGQQIVGCILAVREGGLNAELITQIQLGARRPRGQLAPVTLANQLGLTEAAQQACWRVMRIAVHPQCQQLGLGSQLLQHFIAHNPADYYATSFGATKHLIRFWLSNQFRAVKLGSQRDQASGCYSLLMVRASGGDWMSSAEQQFYQHLCYELKDSLQGLDTGLVQALMAARQSASSDQTVPYHLLSGYAHGGANYESVAVWIEQLLLALAPQQWLELSELMIAKVVQQRSWQECARRYHYTGRKQAEQDIRTELAKLLSNLHCKLTA